MSIAVGDQMIEAVRQSLQGAPAGELVPIHEMGGHYAERASQAEPKEGFDHLCEIEVDGERVQVYLKH